MENFQSQISKKIEKTFSLEEIKILCYELPKDFDIDFENLTGDTKRLKIYSLIQHIERRNLTFRFLRILKDSRPNASWPKLPQTLTIKIETEVADALNIKSDAQLVKHFYGAVGGAEYAFYELMPEQFNLAYETFDNGHSNFIPIQIPTNLKLGLSLKSIILLNFGELENFSSEKLESSLQEAINFLVSSGIFCIATPIFGSSREVGFELKKSLEVILLTMIEEITQFSRGNYGKQNDFALIFFDKNPAIVSQINIQLSKILKSAKIEFEKTASGLFELHI